jgi:competence protein ComGE
MFRRNEQGFFLLELLLSLSAWFMLCFFLLPSLMDMRAQTMMTEVHQKAVQLMYEELQAKLLGETSYADYSVYNSGVEYQIYWRDSILKGSKEVCVKVEHITFIDKTEVCTSQE